MASGAAAVLITLLAFFASIASSTQYVLGSLNKCTRVPDEAPCHVPYEHFVLDYVSQRYDIMMELIYRKAKDVSRLDSRPQCVNAYKAFLCSQFFPRCSKRQNPRFQNPKMQRWVIHDSAIHAKCHQIFSLCNERVTSRFMSSNYFLCDHVLYTPYGWESDRCVPYDLDSRCPARYGKLPLWYLNYHDQNVVQYLNATLLRINNTLPQWCRRRVLNIICRHPSCSDDHEFMVTNYTRQECDHYLKCARFVPGEINVNALCILFPSSAMTLAASSALILIATCLCLFT